MCDNNSINQTADISTLQFICKLFEAGAEPTVVMSILQYGKQESGQMQMSGQNRSLPCYQRKVTWRMAQLQKHLLDVSFEQNFVANSTGTDRVEDDDSEIADNRQICRWHTCSFYHYGLQPLIHRVSAASQQVGLIINMAETKVMVSQCTLINTVASVTVSGEKLEQISSCV